MPVLSRVPIESADIYSIYSGHTPRLKGYSQVSNGERVLFILAFFFFFFAKAFFKYAVFEDVFVEKVIYLDLICECLTNK